VGGCIVNFSQPHSRVCYRFKDGASAWEHLPTRIHADTIRIPAQEPPRQPPLLFASSPNYTGLRSSNVDCPVKKNTINTSGYKD
jgi:hypothetical protein